MNASSTEALMAKQSRRIESIQTIYLVVLGIYAYGNFVVEVAPFLTQVISVVRAIADATLLYAGINFINRRENSFLKKILLLFLIISSITFSLNSATTTIVGHLNGLREPLMFIIALAILTSLFHSHVRKEFVRRMNNFLIVFLVIQVPITIYQFLRYGAGDLVGGTFSDGGSGMVSQVIFLGVYYFYIIHSCKPIGYGYYTKSKFTLLLLLIPVFINETKISFVYLGTLVALQLKLQLNIGRLILSIVTGIVLMFLFVKILAVTTSINLLDYMNMDVFESYYLSEWTDGSEGQDITRIGKIVLTVYSFDDNINKHAFGVGYGLMKGKYITGSSVAGKEYEKLYFGSKIMFFTGYIQGGITLVALFLLLNFFYFFRSRNTSHRSHFIRYKLFVLSIFSLMWIYNDALFVTYFNLFASYFLIFVKYGDLSEDVPPQLDNGQSGSVTSAKPALIETRVKG